MEVMFQKEPSGYSHSAIISVLPVIVPYVIRLWIIIFIISIILLYY
jgi:hypothetical protein